MSVTMALRVGMIVGLALITAANPRGSRTTALEESGSGSGEDESGSGSGSGDDEADGPPSPAAPSVTSAPPVGIPADRASKSNDIDAAETVGIVFGVLVVGFAAVVYMRSRENEVHSRKTSMSANPMFSSVRITTHASAAGAASLPGKHTVLKETNC